MQLSECEKISVMTLMLLDMEVTRIFEVTQRDEKMNMSLLEVVIDTKEEEWNMQSVGERR